MTSTVPFTLPSPGGFSGGSNENRCERQLMPVPLQATPPDERPSYGQAGRPACRRNKITVVIEPFQGFRDLICTDPGIGPITADVILAETGADMTRCHTSSQPATASTTSGRRSARLYVDRYASSLS